MLDTRTAPYAATPGLGVPCGGPWLVRGPVALAVLGPAGAAPIRA